MPRYKQERREQVRRLHGRGLTDIEIAQKLGVQGPWVCRLRQQLGLPRNTSWSPADAFPLYRQGLTDSEIGEKLGVGWLTILKWRKRENLPAHPRRLNVAVSHEERRRIYLETRNDRELAERLGMSQAATQKWRSKMGLPPKGTRSPGSGRKKQAERLVEA